MSLRETAVTRKSRLLLSATVLAASCAAGRPSAALPAADREAMAEAERGGSGGYASARAYSHYLRARLAQGEGRLRDALEEMRQALVFDPASPQLHISAAEIMARLSRLGEAEAEARRALDIEPAGRAGADGSLLLARILAARGKRVEARAEARRAVELAAVLAKDPDPAGPDPDPWRLLGRLQLDSGDEAGAAATYEELAALLPVEGATAFREMGRAFLEAGDRARAEKWLRRALDKNRSDLEAWKRLATLEEGRLDDDAARAAWESALRAEPDDLEALLALGKLSLRQKDLAAARAWFAHLLAADRDDVGARVAVAFAWLEARQPAEALAAAGAAADPRLDFVRGVAFQEQRRWGEAAAAFEKVEGEDGELWVNARTSLALSLSQMGRHAEAVRSLERALAARPRDEALLYALGAAYEKAGDMEAALAKMRALLAINAGHADALNFVGYAYAERGTRLEEAERLLGRALEIRPDNGFFLDSLGWVYFKRGDYPRAVKTLERASEISGPEPTILEHLGDAYRSAQRTSDAARAYRSALETFDAAAPDPAQAAQRKAVERKLEEVMALPAAPGRAGHGRDASAEKPRSRVDSP